MRLGEQNQARGGFDLLGETLDRSLQLSLSPSLKVDFQGSRVTSDSGLPLVRELDERSGLSGLIAENIRDVSSNPTIVDVSSAILPSSG